jgi:uncharacterized membrane protein
VTGILFTISLIAIIISVWHIHSIGRVLRVTIIFAITLISPMLGYLLSNLFF